MIDLMNIEPNVPSKNLKNFVGMIYGDPGCGKTSEMAKVPKSLLIATEIGYKALAGVHAQPALTYTAILTILNQLKKPQVKEKYEVVIIDTQDALFHIIEKYVLEKNGAAKINDIPWGAGHTEMLMIWQKIIKSIIKEGYGLILIGHRTLKYDEENEDNRYNTIALNNKKVKNYLMSEVDYAAYVESSRDPARPSVMHFRSTMQWEAKARFKHIVPNTEFSYENLVKAIHDAVEKESSNASEKKINFHEDPSREEISVEEFNQLKKETEDLAREIIESDANKTNEIVALIDQYLGKKIAESIPSDAPRMKLLKEALEQL